MTALVSTGESSRVTFGLTVLHYQIRRSPRRSTVSIAVDPLEGLVVTAPASATRKRLDQLVRRKGAWITRRLRRQSDLPPPLVAREFVSGETFRYLGRQYQLKTEPAVGVGSVRLEGARLVVRVAKGLAAAPRSAEVRRMLIAWYRTRALAVVPRRAAQWASRLGLEEPKVLIAEPPKRWGSASKSAGVRVNWRVVQAPTSLIDYVVVHELVHLIHENHGRAFWAQLGRVMPDYEQRKSRLRELGPSLIW